MASATELIHIPLNSGLHQEADKKLLPNGLLSSTKNIRLKKDGAIGARFGFTATPNTDDEGAALKVFDVVSHEGQLLAFGSTNASAGGPEKVFTYTGSKWRGEAHGATRPRYFSAISEVTEVYRPPFAKTDEAMRYDVAYAGGYLALVYEGHSDDSLVYVSVFDPTTGSEVLQTTVTGRFAPRVAAAGSVFTFAWVDTSGDVRMATFDPATGTALSAESTIHTAGTVTAGIDLCSVGTSEVVLFVVHSGSVTVRRISASLVVQATGTPAISNVSLGSVAATATGTTLIAYVTTSNTYHLLSLVTSSMASSTGPTALFSGSTGTLPPGLAVRGTQVIATAAIVDTIDRQMKVDVRTISSHAVIAQYTHREVGAMSKPFVSPDAQFAGVLSPYGKEELFNFTGIVDVEYCRGYELAHNRGFAVDVSPDCLGSVATDGTRYWAVFPTTDLNCSHTPTVVQFRVMSPERRQTASLGGLLYVAGGFVGVWDGQRLVESGFVDTPKILSVVGSTAAGQLTGGGFYGWVMTYEWFDGKGNRHISPVSDQVQLTLGGAHNTATLVVSTPHSIRRVMGSDTGGKILLYRTRNGTLTLARAVYAFPTSTFAQAITLTDLASDAEVLTQEVVYTQGSRGALSGPLAHEAPFPCMFMVAKRSRLLLGRLPNPSQWQQSKNAFPGEPIEFSGTPGFFGNVRGKQTGVATQDDSDYVFTRSEVFVVDGYGPDDNGNGEFNAPRKLPGDSVGCIDWRSIVSDATGVWFQAYPDRLYRIPRGGGAPEWASQAVRDVLAEFPVITASAVVPQDNVVAWACSNTGGTAGRLVCFDSRTGEWFVDELTELGSAPVSAMCEHEGRLVIVVGNRAYIQDAAAPSASFIAYEFTTGSIAPFGTEGHGKLVGFTLTGKRLTDCSVTAYISYDDETSFVEAHSVPQAVDADTPTNGSLALTWNPLRRKGSRFTLRVAVAPLGGSVGAGIEVNNITLEVQQARRPRRSAIGRV